MGVTSSRRNFDFEVFVKTGDVKGAGTDSNVYCVLVDENDNRSRDILLDVRWRNDFEKGSVDIFKIRNVSNVGKINQIELWRDNRGIGDDWFAESIKIKQYTIYGYMNIDARSSNKGSNNQEEKVKQSSKPTVCNRESSTYLTTISNPEWIPFPCNRWIHPNRKYVLLMYDSYLPQFDKRTLQRKQELEEKRAQYVFSKNAGDTPKTVVSVPREEQFSNDYKWDIVGKKVRFLAQKKFMKLLSSDKWNQLDDLLDVYKGSFGIPYGYYNWRSDKNFGHQRLRGCNPTLIMLCTKLPENFAVTCDMVAPFLDGMTLNEAIVKKEIFILNLKILNELTCKDCRTVCAPMALFHAKKDGKLLPIAIQLFQEPSAENPVFLPNDPPYTWMLAKMYFNNADCMLHQSCTHLGFTHLLCESICISVHRSLSPSHPIFRLLAPHFLYLIAINSLAVQKLLSPDGWIDVTMTIGVCGLSEILKRTWKTWRLDEDGWLPADLKKRGVDDINILPSYMYRDDAILLHEAILRYVSEVITNVYDTPEKLTDDFEVHEWGNTLVDPVNGCGIKGVFGDGKFSVLDDLIKTVTSVIFLSSVAHAAANFGQYDEYAFPPNYPATLSGNVPRDKEPRTEQDILDHLPNRDVTLSIMVVTKILSDRGTKPLGDFEVQYQYEPKAVAAVERFRANLHEISQTIKERNRQREEAYLYLDPEEVPNAISI